MTTQNDIAREAGRSAATVSRALAGDPRINRATRIHIEEIASRLGYIDYIDRKFSRFRQRDKRRAIGLVIPTILTNSFYEDTSLLHDLLSREGYSIILCVHHNNAEEDEAILNSLVAQSVDGIVHVPCTADGAQSVFNDIAPVPIVELGTRSPSKRLNLVTFDDDTALAELVAHVVSLGHQRIALFTGRKHLYHIQTRSRSFHRAISAASLIKTDCPVIFGPSSVQGSREEMLRLLDGPSRPTAIIVANKPASIGVLLALRERRVSIPKEMSIVGYLDEDWYAVGDPPITAYEHPLRDMGMMAAQILLQETRVNGEEHEPRTVRFVGRLEIRESTAPPLSS